MIKVLVKHTGWRDHINGDVVVFDDDSLFDEFVNDEEVGLICILLADIKDEEEPINNLEEIDGTEN